VLGSIATASIHVKSLEETDSGRVALEKLGPYNANSVEIGSATQIWNELMLHIPRSEIFAAIDCVLVIPDERLVFYVQVTVSAMHLINYIYLENIYNTLIRQPEFQDYTHMLLFMVPIDAFDKFKLQPIDIDVTQYVGTIDTIARSYWRCSLAKKTQ